jgi:hypothetical protein
MSQDARRVDPSVVPGAWPAPSPGFIEPCRPALARRLLQADAGFTRSSSTATGHKRTCETASLPCTPPQAMVGRCAFSRGRGRSGCRGARG